MWIVPVWSFCLNWFIYTESWRAEPKAWRAELCLCWCKTLLCDVPGLLNGNKLGFQTFTPLATYSKPEQSVLNYSEYKMNNFVGKTTADWRVPSLKMFGLMWLKCILGGNPSPFVMYSIVIFRFLKVYNGTNLSCYINIKI